MLRIHSCCHLIPNRNLALDYTPPMHDEPLGDALRVLDNDPSARPDDLAAISHLAAPLGVEGSLRKQHLSATAILSLHL